MLKVCEICGKEYDAIRSTQKTCSVVCRKKKDADYMQLYRSVYGSPRTSEQQQIYNFRAKARAKGLWWDGTC